MEEQLVAILLANVALDALVDGRIFWAKMEPDETLPRIVMNVISSVTDYHMTGPSGLKSTRVQIDCYGLTYASAKAVSRAVETVISGYQGVSGTVKFDGIFKIQERDAVNEDATPSDWFGVSVDYEIFHKEN